ncbi:hypothetical protein AbraIFM66951_006114 [Aspergillus brasiliensis]|uniref:Uncharacterized protein n=1 Tax=Aspergillus brasiliensis TaxID=319629 RepID=A0A9W6DUK5_9EURO|nr:hypothetical protein AbraCBS73388_005179 [Aspergillus brasiliensis]GKZ51561.1 hypothetical protein AbraIFM66951_006114 [Aspergillus brasiliensis]
MYTFNNFPYNLSEQVMSDLSDHYQQPDEAGLPVSQEENSVFSAALQGISRMEHNEAQIPSESAFQRPGAVTAVEAVSTHSSGTPSDLVLQKLSEVESAVHRLNDKVARGTAGRDRATDNPDIRRAISKIEGAVNETIEERIDRLSQRVENLTSQVDGFAIVVDSVSLLSSRIDAINRYMTDFSNLLHKEKERTNAMSSGVDEACRRFHHLLASISRPLEPGDLMGFYDM